jgi:hypothetical protein
MKDIIDSMMQMKITENKRVPEDLLSHYISDFYMGLNSEIGDVYIRTEFEIGYREIDTLWYYDG